MKILIQLIINIIIAFFTIKLFYYFDSNFIIAFVGGAVATIISDGILEIIDIIKNK